MINIFSLFFIFVYKNICIHIDKYLSRVFYVSVINLCLLVINILPLYSIYIYIYIYIYILPLFLKFVYKKYLYVLTIIYPVFFKYQLLIFVFYYMYLSAISIYSMFFIFFLVQPLFFIYQ